MKRATLVAVVAVLAVVILSTGAESFAAEPLPTIEPVVEPATQPASQPTTKPASPLAIAKQKALEQYRKVLDRYMSSDFAGRDGPDAFDRETSKVRQVGPGVYQEDDSRVPSTLVEALPKRLERQFPSQDMGPVVRRQFHAHPTARQTPGSPAR
jgi:hypothetical protein